MIATSEWEKRKAARNECYRRGLDFRCGEDGGGGHPRASRFNPQGDAQDKGLFKVPYWYLKREVRRVCYHKL